MTGDDEEHGLIVHLETYQYVSRAALIPTLAAFFCSILTRRVRHLVGIVSPQWQGVVCHPLRAAPSFHLPVRCANNDVLSRRDRAIRRHRKAI
jgi:hypothetical protein